MLDSQASNSLQLSKSQFSSISLMYIFLIQLTITIIRLCYCSHLILLKLKEVPCEFDCKILTAYNIYISIEKMFKKFKFGFFANETQRQFQNTKFDKTHQLMQPSNINKTVNLYTTSRNQFLTQIGKGLGSTQLSLKIKTLVIIHACIRKTFSQQLSQIIMNYQVENQQNLKKSQKKVGDHYIQVNVINYYVLYLKKICMQKQSYLYVKQYTKKIIATQYNTEAQLEHEQNMQIVTHGFKILNLINYILQSMEMFNKMGRYHYEYKQILNMYLQFLQDLDLFNSFVKNSVKIIVSKDNQVKLSMENMRKVQNFLTNGDIQIDQIDHKSKIFTSSTQAETSNNIISEKIHFAYDEAQQIKHYYLYINESQKVSDRLYEYYHNRYYYKQVRHYTSFPTFLTLDNKDYLKLKNKAKRIDKNLVNLVKRSKYDGDSTLNDVGSFKTDPGINLNTTFQGNRENFTELDQSLKDAYQNLTFNMVVSSKNYEQEIQLEEQL